VVVRKVTAILFVLALLGASMQCVADCLTEHQAPPGQQHSKSEHSVPEPCKHAQAAADQPAALLSHVSEPEHPMEISFQPPPPGPVLETPRDPLLLTLRI